MLHLNSTVLIPLYIKRKPLIRPVIVMCLTLLLLLLIPYITASFVRDEVTKGLVLVLCMLIMIIPFTISGIAVIKAAVDKQNSVFKFIPDAPKEAVVKTQVEFDFDSEPGQVCYRNMLPEVLEGTKPIVTLYEHDKVKHSDEFFRISEVHVNQNYKLAMFLQNAVGIGLGGSKYGINGSLQFYWYVLMEEEYDKLMRVIEERNVSIPVSQRDDWEAKYIVEGIKARNE